MNPVLVDFLYAGALAVGSPYFFYKMLTTGKYREGLGQRLGFVPPREGERCIWIHGVSVGEVLASRTIVAGLEKALPGAQVVISTTTNTGQAVANRNYRGRHVFYFPLDFSAAVARTFRRIRPRMVILMEMEVWPNFLVQAGREGVPVVVANGRITERAALRLSRLGRLANGFLNGVSLYMVQSETYAERLRLLGVAAERIEVTGNVKFDTLSTDVDTRRAIRLREEMGVRRDEALIIGGSTHRGEEEALLDAYARLRAENKRIRLLIVPRHDIRFGEVAGLVEYRGYKVFRRSSLKGGAQPSGEEVLLGDTMGELEQLYEAADAAFVGGSLIPHGGQNMTEPAAKGKPVVFGPHIENFADASKMLLEAGAATGIEDSGQLAGALAAYIDTEAGARAGRAGREAVIRAKGATARTVDRIVQIMGEKLASPRAGDLKGD